MSSTTIPIIYEIYNIHGLMLIKWGLNINIINRYTYLIEEMIVTTYNKINTHAMYYKLVKE